MARRFLDCAAFMFEPDSSLSTDLVVYFALIAAPAVHYRPTALATAASILLICMFLPYCLSSRIIIADAVFFLCTGRSLAAYYRKCSHSRMNKHTRLVLELAVPSVYARHAHVCSCEICFFVYGAKEYVLGMRGLVPRHKRRTSTR